MPLMRMETLCAVKQSPTGIFGQTASKYLPRLVGIGKDEIERTGEPRNELVRVRQSGVDGRHR